MLLLILFPQNGRSPTLRAYNSGAKLQIKIERTKKKGEKLKSCSLDYISFFIEEIASFSEGSSFSIIHHIWSASISK